MYPRNRAAFALLLSLVVFVASQNCEGHLPSTLTPQAFGAIAYDYLIVGKTFLGVQKRH